MASVKVMRSNRSGERCVLCKKEITEGDSIAYNRKLGAGHLTEEACQAANEPVFTERAARFHPVALKLDDEGKERTVYGIRVMDPIDARGLAGREVMVKTSNGDLKKRTLGEEFTSEAADTLPSAERFVISQTEVIYTSKGVSLLEHAKMQQLPEPDLVEFRQLRDAAASGVDSEKSAMEARIAELEAKLAAVQS
jgi:hypothetical protein